MKIVRKLTWDSVRSYCINNDLYTRGFNEDYTRLYNYIADRDNYIGDNDLELDNIISGLNRLSYYEVL